MTAGCTHRTTLLVPLVLAFVPLVLPVYKVFYQSLLSSCSTHDSITGTTSHALPPSHELTRQPSCCLSHSHFLLFFLIDSDLLTDNVVCLCRNEYGKMMDLIIMNGT